MFGCPNWGLFPAKVGDTKAIPSEFQSASVVGLHKLHEHFFLRATTSFCWINQWLIITSPKWHRCFHFEIQISSNIQPLFFLQDSILKYPAASSTPLLEDNPLLNALCFHSYLPVLLHHSMDWLSPKNLHRKPSIFPWKAGAFRSFFQRRITWRRSRRRITSPHPTPQPNAKVTMKIR